MAEADRDDVTDLVRFAHARITRAHYNAGLLRLPALLRWRALHTRYTFMPNIEFSTQQNAIIVNGGFLLEGKHN